jgi:RNA polymerase sigma-70 factor, ECF subfamily
VSQLPDEELVARCGRGDRRAMDELVSRYHGKLLDFVFRSLGDREMAADIAQSTFIRAFQAAANYKALASFKTWLYTVALNLVRDEFRRRGARVETLSSDSDELPGREVDSPEDSVLERMSSVEIWTAVDNLSDDHRSAIVLKFRQDLTYDEIAAVMGAPAGTVKSWVHYGLKALRQSLEPTDCED